MAAGGGTPAGAEAAAERLIAEGATALLSFGLAGGLDPCLAAGMLFTPHRLIDETGAAHDVDASLTARPDGRSGLMLASDRIIASNIDKAAARAATGADAVDCESGAVARVARRHQRPFAILRAICDTAADTLPPAALVPLGDGGRVRLAPVLGSLLAHPAQLPALLRLARQSRLAMAALARV